MHDYRPLHLSRNGRLLVGVGRLLCAYSLNHHMRHDPGTLLFERARQGYGIDVGRNLQVRGIGGREVREGEGRLRAWDLGTRTRPTGQSSGACGCVGA